MLHYGGTVVTPNLQTQAISSVNLYAVLDPKTGSFVGKYGTSQIIPYFDKSSSSTFPPPPKNVPFYTRIIYIFVSDQHFAIPPSITPAGSGVLEG